MRCLSNIVKPFAIVDDTTKQKRGLEADAQAALAGMSVIKRNYFNYRRNPYLDESVLMPDKDGYLDELNRLRAEIAEAKAELRGLGRFFESEAQAENPAAQTNAGERERDNSAVNAEAERILENARQEAAEIRALAIIENKRLAEEAGSNAYLEGFDKGFKEAQVEFAAQHNPRIREIENLLESISGYREEMLSQNERQLVELTVTVCEKILGRELAADPRAIVAMLYKVLDENRREQNMRITVSPELMPAEAKVAADVKKLISQTAPGALLTVDEEAGPGTIVVETGKGITDLSVDTQLKNIKDMLLEK